MSEEHATQTNVARCTTVGCTRNATHTYTWDWGESGYCCSTCLVSLRHRMDSLGRTCTFVALQPGAPVELTRDERIQLHARVLAAEDELKLTKARNLVLFNSNQELAAEINSLRLELESFRTQLADAQAEADQLTSEKMKALQQLAETNHELARLQGVVTAANAPA